MCVSGFEGVVQDGEHMAKLVSYENIHSFLREAAALVLIKLSKISNIVELIDIQPCKLVLAKYDEDLSSALWRQTYDYGHIAYQILTIMSDLDQLGIVHRDIKPDNILVKHGSDNLVLCDFGLSRYTDSGQFEHCSSCIQTDGYRAPEVIFNQQICPGTLDIWSLGIMLLNIISINPLRINHDIDCYTALFDGEDFPESIRGNIKDDVDPRFIALVKQMLTINPHERPTSSALLTNIYFDKYRDQTDQLDQTDRAKHIYNFNEQRVNECLAVLTEFTENIKQHNKDDLRVLSSYEYDNEDTLWLTAFLYCKLCRVLDTKHEMSEDQLVSIIGIATAISDYSIFNDMSEHHVHELAGALDYDLFFPVRDRRICGGLEILLSTV